MEVADIMTKKFKSLSPDANAIEALDLLFEMEISGLPVIDERGKLVGMLTEKEILAAILPSYVEKVGSFIYQDNPKAIKQKIINMRGMQVKELMRRNVVTVNEKANLSEVARVMLIQKARRLPVLNQAKEVVGIISRGDIMKALFQEK